MTTSSDKSRASLRRLVLAKQLYQHALEHSQGRGALDKMIAVHNFHNAIEIVLRAILLHYEIRPERALNLDFEALMNEIDRFPEFRNSNKRLPYRQQIRSLNSERNLVQHHAHEPADAGMEEWRVFSHGFLVDAYHEYFGEDFELISPLDFIDDERLRALLRWSLEEAGDNWKDALCACKLAFAYAHAGVTEYLPEKGLNSKFFAMTGFSSGSYDIDKSVNNLVDTLYRRIADVEQYAMTLASGVSPSDLARYERIGISVTILADGNPNFWSRGSEIAAEEVRWGQNFVIATITRWQTSGLGPKVPEWCAQGCDQFLSEQSSSTTPSGAEPG